MIKLTTLFGITFLSTFLIFGTAWAENVDWENQCALLASDPTEPGNNRAGIEFKKIKPKPAILACSYALKANPNSAIIQYRLGRSFLAGNQASKAKLFLKQAVNQNYLPAYTNLGFLYIRGLGTPQDSNKAVSLFSKAAEQGDASAQYNLAVMYYKGLGIQKNNERAAALFQKAAAQGHASAQHNLALMYNKGLGVEKNFLKAASWHQKAAEQGDIQSQLNIGFSYYMGQGVKKDIQLAINWFRKAANNNNSQAQYNLAVMHTKGEGVTRSFEHALNWYKKAALQGHPSAIKALKRINNRNTRRKSDIKITENDILFGLAALVVVSAALSPSQDKSTYTKNKVKPYNSCTGLNGLGWYSNSAGNAAALFGCSKY